MANYKVGLKTKDIVINEARRLFFEKGYDKTTFQDIADSTGVLPSVIAYHFKSKKNLFLKTFEDFMIKRVAYANSILVENEKENVILDVYFAFCIDYYRAFGDVRWQNFMKIPVDASMEMSKNYYEEILKKLDPIIKSEGDYEEYSLNVNVCFAADNALYTTLFNNFDYYKAKYSFIDVAEYEIRIIAKFFKSDKQKMQEMFLNTRKFAKEFDWSTVNTDITLM